MSNAGLASPGDAPVDKLRLADWNRRIAVNLTGAALTHALANSLAPQVRVNCVSPGWIDVGKSKISKADHAQHAAGRVGRPEDVAELVAYLVSDAAGFVTGQNFVIDGGMTKKMIYV